MGTNHTMQFDMEGISFDLLVAANYVTGNTSKAVEEQRKNSMTKLKQAGDYKKTFGELGVQMTESSVEFMKKKSKFVHDIAKLAKFWNQLMYFNEKIYGRSTIMELLGTKAALEEENNDVSPSHWNAFKRFLEKVEGIKNVNIVFPDYYADNEVPPEIRSQRPLL